VGFRGQALGVRHQALVFSRQKCSAIFSRVFNLKLLPSLRARRMWNAAHLSPQQLYSLPRCARRVFITPRFLNTAAMNVNAIFFDFCADCPRKWSVHAGFGIV